MARALPETVAVGGRRPADIAANDDAVVVAGGERIAALDADDGACAGPQSVVALGKSRGYALPGAVQQVVGHATPSCSCRPRPSS